MNLYFITLFPDIFTTNLSMSIIGRAQDNALFSFKCYNPRNFSPDKHRNVDDHPYGGGKGMVLRADVLELTIMAAFADAKLTLSTYDRQKIKVIATVAGGKSYSQKVAEEYASLEHLFIVCGHYEGIDQRFIEYYCDDEISIGPFVLTGGELPAVVIADSLLRLLPGVLGSDESSKEESYSILDQGEFLVEYPHFTRPAVFNSISVPQVLTSGNHADIARWRLEESRTRTKKR
ncbi:MAG: tRNA (guanosine(37)-N1)-methyltransferase TrmD [bacterium]|nr:tRNA (guanosine(37)-N1)-methyltransferase TrmD [bacterium]